MSVKSQVISMIVLLCFVLCAGIIMQMNKGIECHTSKAGNYQDNRNADITIFMCGDVMTGRGIDQVLPFPGDSLIYEQYMKSAMGYVRLAEQKNGPIPLSVDNKYIWGCAIPELEKKNPDLRMINLETAVTKSNNYWKHKGINYRMSPDNITCLVAAGIDYCALANNHTLDWGYEGLSETLATLNKAGIKHSGAGMSVNEARKPAIFEMKEKGRILVFSFGFTNSGIPRKWAAGDNPGLNLFTDFSMKTVTQIKNIVDEYVTQDDIVVASIHWGRNWDYGLEPNQEKFAHRLIDEVGVDVIHGHSSHHVKDIEVYNDRLILYGCGDFLNDYEGIRGHESYRDDLGLMYFVSLDASSGKLNGLQMVPTKIKNLRIIRPGKSEICWMCNLLNREGEKYGTSVKLVDDENLMLEWK